MILNLNLRGTSSKYFRTEGFDCQKKLSLHHEQTLINMKIVTVQVVQILNIFVSYTSANFSNLLVIIHLIHGITD